MKYLKTYEDLDNNPEIGDYVICEEADDINDILELADFEKNNIGRVVDYRTVDNTNPTFDSISTFFNIFVQYKNVPNEIYDDFDYHKRIANCRIFSKKEIKYCSKNKEDLEIILQANKFNI